MGLWTEIIADDGHAQSAYWAPVTETGAGAEAPGIVLLQEIFGVTPALRELADAFQAQGYNVVVPALYDRIQPNCVIDYDDTDRARAMKNQLQNPVLEADIRAAIAHADSGQGVALVGYCWGGGLAYWAAQNCRVQAVVSYYGTNVAKYCEDAPPSAPCQFHLGVDDPMIDADAREVISNSCRPIDQYFEYEGAGHAFANASRTSYRQEQAYLAEQRTLSFLSTAFQGDSTQ